MAVIAEFTLPSEAVPFVWATAEDGERFERQLKDSEVVTHVAERAAPE